MQDSISILLKLCNRSYKVKVAPENEATVRKTMQELTDKLNDIKKNFPGRDDHDYMAMTLIDFITSAKMPLNNQLADSTEISEKLQQLNQLLDA